MEYTKGLQISSEMVVGEKHYLSDLGMVKRYLDAIKSKYKWVDCIEFIHQSDFGITGIIRSTEGFVFINTLLEVELLQLDVYFSNHLKDNESKVVDAFTKAVVFFEAENNTCTQLYR